MNWKTLVTIIALSPFATLLGGIGILAYNISQTWDARNTDALINGLISSCAMGGLVMAGLFALILGVPLAMRLMDRWRESDRYIRTNNRQAPRQQLPPALYETPPLLQDKSQQGSWQSLGPGQYDLWDDDKTIDGEWHQNE